MNDAISLTTFSMYIYNATDWDRYYNVRKSALGMVAIKVNLLLNITLRIIEKLININNYY